MYRSAIPSLPAASRNSTDLPFSFTFDHFAMKLLFPSILIASYLTSYVFAVPATSHTAAKPATQVPDWIYFKVGKYKTPDAQMGACRKFYNENFKLGWKCPEAPKSICEEGPKLSDADCKAFREKPETRLSNNIFVYNWFAHIFSLHAATWDLKVRQ